MISVEILRDLTFTRDEIDNLLRSYIQQSGSKLVVGTFMANNLKKMGVDSDLYTVVDYVKRV